MPAPKNRDPLVGVSVFLRKGRDSKRRHRGAIENRRGRFSADECVPASGSEAGRISLPAPSSSRTVYRSRRLFYQNPSLIHAVAPPLHIRPASLGSDMVFLSGVTDSKRRHRAQRGTTHRGGPSFWYVIYHASASRMKMGFTLGSGVVRTTTSNRGRLRSILLSLPKP